MIDPFPDLLSGMLVVVSGKLRTERAQLEDMIHALGARITVKLATGVDFVILGTKSERAMRSAEKDAAKLGLPSITEDLVHDCFRLRERRDAFEAWKRARPPQPTKLHAAQLGRAHAAKLRQSYGVALPPRYLTFLEDGPELAILDLADGPVLGTFALAPLDDALTSIPKLAAALPIAGLDDATWRRDFAGLVPFATLSNVYSDPTALRWRPVPAFLVFALTPPAPILLWDGGRLYPVSPSLDELLAGVAGADPMLFHPALGTPYRALAWRQDLG